ncbi:MAG: segregation/condensation protein A [Acidimicrobiia bacterium]|nr:segregation/condensation protein A [Acidimicrobiia bacterium]
MSFEVRTAVFEGPLDLLLQLVTRHQVDIAGLSLIDLVTEYVSYIDEMRRLDLDVTSEFLLIAATLIQLKARHLLPDDIDIDIDEELALMEERDRLISRLLQCVTFKDVAAILAHRFQANNRYVERRVGMESTVVQTPPDVRIPLDLEGFAALAARVFVEQSSDIDLDHLDLDMPSVANAIDELRVRIASLAETTFDDVVAHCTRKVEVVAYFLALLELARWGMVDVAQEDWLSEIEIRHTGDGDVRLSEWSQ